ncbi:MAG: hypothetical protein AB7P03_07180 [Kofleriaceae bacterium]
MFLRIGVLAIALLLGAAAADPAIAEVPDAQAAALALCDDEAVTQICGLSRVAERERVTCTSIANDSVPLKPDPARVFRPPRPSFG